VNRPATLLERTFVAALVDPTSPDHQRAAECFRNLLVEFAADRRRLVITDDIRGSLRAAPIGLLDPVETLYVTRHERDAAEHICLDVAAAVNARELALNLVVLRRRHIAALATFDFRYEAFAVELLPGRWSNVDGQPWRASTSPHDARAGSALSPGGSPLNLGRR
jgi:hypothetical protein